MADFSIFVGHISFPIGGVNMRDVVSETKVYERKYGEIYKTDVISTFYNEVAIVFSIEEADEDDALEYFEREQAELYGTFDMDEFKKQFSLTMKKKSMVVDSLKESIAAVQVMEKEIEKFQNIFNVKDFSESEKIKTDEYYQELRNLTFQLGYLKRSMEGFR